MIGAAERGVGHRQAAGTGTPGSALTRSRRRAVSQDQRAERLRAVQRDRHRSGRSRGDVSRLPLTAGPVAAGPIAAGSIQLPLLVIHWAGRTGPRTRSLPIRLSW